MKISIIVPVYNIEKYIEKCLKSLINQTIQNIEILFINDGSTDNSVKIIQKYQKKYPQINLLNKENGGLSDARNYGLKYASGDYVCFIDGDDYIDYHFCEKLNQIITKEDYDIVLFNYRLAYLDGSYKDMQCFNSHSRLISKEEFMLATPSACNKMFKKSFLQKVKFQFPKGMIYEDLASIPTLSKYNPRVYYLDKYLYYYVQSENSITRNKIYNKKQEDIFKAIDLLYESLKNTDLYKELEYITVYHLLYLANLNFYEYQKFELIDRVSLVMKKYFPHWKKNKLLKQNFTIKERIYLHLFYYRKYKIIDIYRKVLRKNV